MNDFPVNISASDFYQVLRENRNLRTALSSLYGETKEYNDINYLESANNNQSMVLARKALFGPNDKEI
jgi:hypothetical protein